MCSRLLNSCADVAGVRGLHETTVYVTHIDMACDGMVGTARLRTS